MCVSVCTHACTHTHSVVSNCLQSCGLQSTRLLRPWEFPGKSTGVGCHCLLPVLSYSNSKGLTKWKSRLTEIYGTFTWNQHKREDPESDPFLISPIWLFLWVLLLLILKQTERVTICMPTSQKKSLNSMFFPFNTVKHKRLPNNSNSITSI